MSEEPRVALVTGGGTGIGAACCRALAAEGFRVGVHYRSSEESARKLAAELGDAFTVRADMAAAEDIDALIAELKERAGRVDVLVNNAGHNVNAPMLSMKLEDYDAVAGVARGTWYLTKLVLRRFMMRKKTGRIVNISSVVGHTGNPGQIPYTMVKAGLDAFSKSLAQELAGRDITVNSVAPGFIETDMTSELPEEMKQAILMRIPLQRMGRRRGLARHPRRLRQRIGDPRQRRALRRLAVEEEREARGVSNPRVVDLVSFDAERDEVVLLMLEERPWESEPGQLRQLEDKFNAYLGYVLDGWLAKHYPDYAGKDICFQLDCATAPSGEVARMLPAMQNFAAAENIRLVVRVIHEKAGG